MKSGNKLDSSKDSDRKDIDDEQNNGLILKPVVAS